MGAADMKLILPKCDKLIPTSGNLENPSFDLEFKNARKIKILDQISSFTFIS